MLFDCMSCSLFEALDMSDMADVCPAGASKDRRFPKLTEYLSENVRHLPDRCIGLTAMHQERHDVLAVFCCPFQFGECARDFPAISFSLHCMETLYLLLRRCIIVFMELNLHGRLPRIDVHTHLMKTARLNALFKLVCLAGHGPLGIPCCYGPDNHPYLFNLFRLFFDLVLHLL